MAFPDRRAPGKALVEPYMDVLAGVSGKAIPLTGLRTEISGLG
jgi:hypothetical protein